MNLKFIRCVVVMSAFGLALAGLAGEFAPDKNTLFLAHFNSSLDADFVKGSAEHIRGHASLTANQGGKFGEGLVCRKGMVANPMGISGPFWPVTFLLDGNLALKEGTLEFWYKPDFSQKVDATNSMALYYIFDIPTRLTDSHKRMCRFCLVIRECFNKATATTEQYFHCYFRDNNEIQVVVSWKPGEWHHIAVTWNQEKGTLFFDGKLVDSRPTPGGLFGGDRSVFMDEFFVGGLFCLPDTVPAEGIIDELRISNKIRYLENFEP